MSAARQPLHGQWASTPGFVLAALGSAIGLGNIWRFSYVVGENGGGAFILVYVIAVLGLGLPLLIAELAIGRSAQADAITAYGRLARGWPWRWIGWLGVAASVAILSYYPVVAGWVARYLWSYAIDGLVVADGTTHAAHFRSFIADPFEAALWLGVFVIRINGTGEPVL